MTDELDDLRKIEMERIQKEAEQALLDEIKNLTEERVKQLLLLEEILDCFKINFIVKYFGEDVILDEIGFETCKEYFKIELEQE